MSTLHTSGRDMVNMFPFRSSTRNRHLFNILIMARFSIIVSEKTAFTPHCFTRPTLISESV